MLHPDVQAALTVDPGDLEKVHAFAAARGFTVDDLLSAAVWAAGRVVAHPPPPALFEAAKEFVATNEALVRRLPLDVYGRTGAGYAEEQHRPAAARAAWEAANERRVQEKVAAEARARAERERAAAEELERVERERAAALEAETTPS